MVKTEKIQNEVENSSGSLVTITYIGVQSNITNICRTVVRSVDIKAKAREIGFDLVGIAPADKLTEEEEFLRKWIGNGYHAGMTWFERSPERRSDPESVLQNCRSVIVVGQNYNLDEQPDDTANDPAGKIARYALRRDYHKSMGKALRKLAESIDNCPHDGFVKSLWYVDTGPILERSWAQRAGIGFIGKNTCLINRRLGSYYFLGVVLTTLELEPDNPEPENGCGTCTRCLDACPTNALIEPGVLDSNLCLSYLTIEHKGDITPQLQPQINDWLFGCDICQEVCPYNVKFGKPAPPESMLGQPIHPPAIPLERILSINDHEELIDYIGAGSPLKRAKLTGLKRTANLILQNSSPKQESD